MNDLTPGVDNFLVSWYPEPYKIINKNGIMYEGTFRSAACTDTTSKESGICHNCQTIPKLLSFRKRLRVRTSGVRDTTKINNRYLNHEEMINKLKNQSVVIEENHDERFFLETKLKRLKIKSRNQKEELLEFTKRGNLRAVCYNLEKAEASGLLKEQGFIKDFLTTLSSNMVVKKQGKRFQPSQKLFYEALSYMGGPRLVNYFSINFGGPNIHSVYEWRQKNKLTLTGTLSEDNFISLKEIYAGLTEKTGQVPVERSEDETAIISKITYHEDTDMLRGFCGVNGENHQCVDNFEIKVGNGAEGYRVLTSAFETCRKGSYARAILLNPLHPRLPKLAVSIQATCNKFNHMFVYHQWQLFDRLYELHLEPVLGPLVGGSSDGDSRRRKLMVMLSTGVDGERLWPVPRNEGFIFTARKEVKCDNVGGYVIRDLADQDFIHNVKKIINLLLHSSRAIMVGEYLAHINHLEIVANMFPVLEHGLTATDITRDDRQNYRRAEKLAFKSVSNCLKCLIDGHENNPAQPHLKGIFVYLKIIWYYIDIFQNVCCTLTDKIKYAATIIIFWGIWHNYINITPGLTLQHNFITRETYTDILLSCHAVVSLITFMRDNMPNQECHLQLMGTDCVEELWSKMGQWTGNHHNYTFGDLQRNHNHLVRLEQIQLNPNAPEYAKPHPKKESVWYKQYIGIPKANLAEYPTADGTLHAWREGICKAKELATYAGMFPHDNIEADWFHHPFDDPGNSFKSNINNLHVDEGIEQSDEDNVSGDFMGKEDENGNDCVITNTSECEQMEEEIADTPPIDNRDIASEDISENSGLFDIVALKKSDIQLLESKSN